MGNFTIITKHESYVIAECARCGGDGTMRYTTAGISKSGTCEVCDGKGEAKVHKTPPFRECNKCEGNGDTGTPASTCTICGGIGFLSHDDLSSVE